MTHQHAPPARNGIQVTSAPPQTRKTAPRAITAPAQTGSNKTAMKNLSHLSTRQRLKAQNFGLCTFIFAFKLARVNQDQVLNVFRDTGAFLEGHFILRSGLHSREYFQCALALQEMPLVEQLGGALAKKVEKWEAVTVMAPAIGGLVIGQEVARQLRLRFIFAEKEDGKLALRRGFKIEKGEKILIVEDVVTKGGRVKETMDIVYENGGYIVGVAAIVDRSNGTVTFGVPFMSLLSLNVETFESDKLPPDLKGIPAVKPGSK